MKPLKPRIFISSTVYDLPNEREAAKRAVEITSKVNETTATDYFIKQQLHELKIE